MTIADRDLLVLEPALFRDHAWLGQRIWAGTASVDNGIASLEGAPLDILAAGVQAGMVMVHAGVAFEIRDTIGVSEVILAPLRAAGAEWVSMGDRLKSPAYVATFAPQLAVARRAVLRMIGIEPDSQGTPPEAPREQDITNPDALTRLIACMTLQLVFAAAAAPGQPGSALLSKSEWYRRAFNEERSRVRVEIDLDGDGRADVVRTPASFGLVRG